MRVGIRYILRFKLIDIVTENGQFKATLRLFQAGRRTGKVRPIFLIWMYLPLNRGSFAVVRKATNKKTGEKVAVKIISKYPNI